MILALDCGTKTGWCLLRDGRIYESGVEDFTKRRGESNGAMFLRFRAALICLLPLGHHVGIPYRHLLHVLHQGNAHKARR